MTSLLQSTPCEQWLDSLNQEIFESNLVSQADYNTITTPLSNIHFLMEPLSVSNYLPSLSGDLSSKSPQRSGLNKIGDHPTFSRLSPSNSSKS